MAFAPKYLATITINNTLYEYYSDVNYLLALIEQEPTLQLVNRDEKWQIDNYAIPHTVTLQPLYTVERQIPLKEIKQSIHLSFEPYKLTIDSFFKKGGEAVIYKGKLNAQPVIIKTYTKSARTLPWISRKLAPYTPMKYLLFEDLSKAYFVVMEELQELVYNNSTLAQGLAFINLLESIGARHGDISPANIMQDAQGNLKFIDFARSITQGTSFYNKGISDRKALARTLLSAKYQFILSTTPLLQGTIKEGNKATLGKLYRTYLKTFVKPVNDLPDGLQQLQQKPLTQVEETIIQQQFFDWFQQYFPQDNESLQLIAMAR